MGSNTLDNSTSPDTKCYDVSTLFGDPIGDNFSLDEKKAYKCSTALIWAKETGIKYHKEMYVNFTTLSENSSYADFQCALYQMKGTDQLGSGQNCTYPCTSTLPQCPPMGAGLMTNKSLPEVTTEPEGGSSGSWPVWGWILLALGILGVIGGIAAMLMMGGKKKETPKKKKRATKPPAAPAPAPEPTPAATPVLTAPPVYVSSVPTMMTAPPVYTAAPVTYAAPTVMPMATPIQTYAAPVQMASVSVPAATPVMFNQLDTNHDGVITRAEFAAAIR